MSAPDPFVHGANLAQKETLKSKYADPKSKQYLAEIRPRYDTWKSANLALKGPFAASNDGDRAIIDQRVTLLATYKDLVDQQVYAEHFDSRSAFHSSVLEEFLYYLFKDMLTGFTGVPAVGKSHAFKDLFFVPPSFSEMLTRPNARVEIKDHDFIIGVRLQATLRCEGATDLQSEVLEVPAVAIECKTYLDKTMLGGSSTAAQELKTRNPNALYIVVSEWLKLSSDVNLRKYDVDQIYVLRRQKNTDREYRYEETYEKKPIAAEVVWHLFDYVRQHLVASWDTGVEVGLERGWLL